MSGSGGFWGGGWRCGRRPLLVVLAVMVVALTLAGAGGGSRLRVSAAVAPANGGSGIPAISADGRFVAFSSEASNLVPADMNGVRDMFVRDRNAGTTERVSVSSAGAEANAASGHAIISANGRFVAFASDASNLVAGDTNGGSSGSPSEGDVFVHDRVTHTTQRVSVSSAGAQANSVSSALAMSADGRFVVFSSGASNLVARDTNDLDDVFVRDRKAGTTVRVSVSNRGAQANSFSLGAAISADGRSVLFDSDASNLVPGARKGGLFVRDRLAHTTGLVSAYGGVGAINANRRVVAFFSYSPKVVPHDTNRCFNGDHYYNCADVFVRDRVVGTTKRVSLSSRGAQGNRDSWVGVGGISADGRTVAFDSYASNLVPGDTNTCVDESTGAQRNCIDVFVHDRKAGTTGRVSVTSAGVQGNGDSYDPVLSPSGRFVAFDSDATNLVAGDTDGATDVFVRDRKTHTTTLVSVGLAQTAPPGS
jgi:Tol biopolymer transport system component